MRLRFAASIGVCIVIALVAALPSAVADTHTITKGDQGPRASAMMWDYVAPGYGNWTGHVVNNGLRSLVVNVYDNSTGMLEEILHQRIRFASYGSYPNGEVNTTTVAMSPMHRYVIEAIPNGPRGASCTFEDVFKAPMPPVVVFMATLGTGPDHMTVYVDASGSYDPDGMIVSYDWDFGDVGSGASGVTATHTYAYPGVFPITLTAMDNDGLMNSTWRTVYVNDTKPIALFMPSISGMTVTVDASWSFDEDGFITDYLWDWGDGTNSSGLTATHQYGGGLWLITLVVTDNNGLMSYPSSQFVFFGPPSEACMVSVGSTYSADGSILIGCAVKITNLRTDESYMTASYTDGYYFFTWWPYTVEDGDVIEVTAVKGDLYGTNSAVVVDPGFWTLVFIDVYLGPVS